MRLENDDNVCKYVKEDGSPCLGFKIKGSDYCYSHSSKEERIKRNIKYRTIMMASADNDNENQ